MFSLTAEQEMMLDAVGDIAQSFEADAFTWEGEVPWENLQTLADHEFLGVCLPEAYGGGGMSELAHILTVEKVGRVCPDTAMVMNAQALVAPRAIAMFGSESVKEQYLPSVTRGESLIAVGISEPSAGSDVASMTSTITEEEGHLYLNGEKTWCSYFPDSDAAIVWAKFPEGIGTVVVDLDDPGIEVANHFTNMAGDTQTHFFMEDVHVPDENVLVRGRDTFKEQLEALNWERLAGAVHANSQAVCALEHALEYAQTREQFGQKIGEFQGLRWTFAEMTRKIEASRALSYQAAATAEAGDGTPDPLAVSIAKLQASQIVEDVVSDALQIFGAAGYQQGHPLEYLYRMARGRSIGGGTNEIVKNRIADLLFERGLPSVDDH